MCLAVLTQTPSVWLRFFRDLKIPAIGVSYLKNIPVLLHDHNEYITEKLFLDGIGFYERIIQAVANC
jgi:aminoacylase